MCTFEESKNVLTSLVQLQMTTMPHNPTKCNITFFLYQREDSTEIVSRKQ